jgi:hypothetical protein
MPANQRAAVAAYFTANPSTSAMVPQGWFRGVLVTSQVYSEPCLGGTCRTWSGTAIEPDGSVATLQSVQGESAVSAIVSIGDDFIWTKDPHPSYSDEVKVLKYGAVPATPAPSPTSSSVPASPSPKRTS